MSDELLRRGIARHLGEFLDLFQKFFVQLDLCFAHSASSQNMVSPIISLVLGMPKISRIVAVRSYRAGESARTLRLVTRTPGMTSGAPRGFPAHFSLFFLKT